jgi:rubrerythrin
MNARRIFLGNTAKLSAAAVTLLAGGKVLAQGSSQDVNILNVALGLEWEGINAYTLGAQSGLLQKPVLEVAVRFQADHKEHADTLAGAIRKLGGKPVEAKSLADYARALKADTLKSQADVLALAARLEMGATNAYLGVIPSFKDAQLAKVAARLAADEVMHWTILNSALGRPLPAGGMPFGA